MRILYFVPYVPNLVRVRPYNLIRHLAQRGHRITVLTLYADAREKADADRLRDHCERVLALPIGRARILWNCLSALPTRAPLQAAYSWEPRAGRALSALLDEGDGAGAFDVVHVEHLRGSRYALWVRAHLAAQGRKLPLVWDSVDCISQLFRQTAVRSRRPLNRLTARLELRRTQRHEGDLLGRFERVLVTSEVDKAALLELAADGATAPVTVLSNGVDLSYFTPIPGGCRPAALVLSGKMSYHANVTMALEFVEGILPRVLAGRPDARLTIVGKDPPRSLQALAAHPAITVTGTVPDVRPHLQKAAVAVAPLRYGAGIQNKVLEAMACGTAVVSTPAAARALAAVPGRDLVTADEPEAFARAILDLLEDEGRRRAIALAGRRYVERHHDWHVIAARLEQIYDDVLDH